MKKLSNLKGARTLKRNEQKTINGGGSKCATNSCQYLPDGAYCAPDRCCQYGCCRPRPDAHQCPRFDDKK